MFELVVFHVNQKNRFWQSLSSCDSFCYESGMEQILLRSSLTSLCEAEQLKAWSKLVGDCVSGVWATVYLCAGMCGRDIFYFCLQNHMVTLG